MRTKQYNQYLELLNYLENKKLTNHKMELDQLISCKNAQIRSRVATFLSNYTDSYAERVLCALLFDKNWIVRSNALQSLEEVGTKYSVEYIMKAYKNEKFEINIPFYISSLTHLYIRNHLDLDELEKWIYSIKLKNYKNLKIIPYILCSLTLLKKENYFDELISIYQFNDKEVKLSVLTALEYICDYEVDNNENYYRTKILNFINEIENDYKNFPYITYKITNIKNKR